MLPQAQPLRRTRLGERLQVTVRARRALSDLSRAHGRQHLVLTWPAGVAVLPAALHRPGFHDAIVGHLAQCPIYVDLRQVAMWPDRQVLLDIAARRVRPGGRPSFVLHDREPTARLRMRPA